MKRPLALALASLAALGVAASAQAQSDEARRGGGWDGDRDARIVFYEYPNFQGRSFTVEGRDRDFSRGAFNDRAQSLRVEGGADWKICEHADFGGRCQVVREDVRDLTRLALARMVSSAEPVRDDRPPVPGPNPGGGGSTTVRDGYEGRATVFFKRPMINGNDLASARGGAEYFCRRVGLGAPVFFDDSERARRAIDRTGRFVADQPVLRDVLCRKR